MFKRSKFLQRIGFKTTKNFIIIGPPGVGKGSFAEQLTKDFNLNRIEIGHYIRKIQSGVNLDFIKLNQNTLNDYLSKKDRTQLWQAILQAKLQQFKKSQEQRGLLLQGCPIGLQGLQKIESLFPIHFVINLSLRQDILIRKLKGRLYCPNCGKNYNTFYIKNQIYDMQPINPKLKGYCDACETGLQKRKDDQGASTIKRVKSYNQRTKPVIAELQRKGILVNFQCKKGMKDYPQLRNLFIRLHQHYQPGFAINSL